LVFYKFVACAANGGKTVRMKIKTAVSLSLILGLCVVAHAQTAPAKKPPSAVKTDAPKSAVKAPASESSKHKEIEAFNEELKQSIMAMDNARVMALWDDNGTNLPFGEAALEGKPAIAKWLDNVTEKQKGWKVTKQDQEFHDIQISGDWASEWANTEQVSQPPEGKKFIGIGKGHGPVTSKGKMLLVLHRGSDGKWKIREEAWVSSQ